VSLAESTPSDGIDRSSDVDHVSTIAFSKTPSGLGFQAVQFTQQNLTAGVAATRSLLPVSSPLTPLDTIVSAFSLSTPYGRAIAYTAVYEGTSLATLNSTRIFTGNEGGEVIDLSGLSNIQLMLYSSTRCTGRAERHRLFICFPDSISYHSVRQTGARNLLDLLGFERLSFRIVAVWMGLET
jgi:hypothetical protein